MDPVKKEIPISTADQALIKETGGEPGIANLEHPKQVRDEIEKNTGFNATPENEIAEKGLEETGKAGFLENVVGVQEEGTSNQSKTPDASLDLEKLGEHLNAFSPIGEENDRGMPSAKANEVELKRQEQLKKAA